MNQKWIDVEQELLDAVAQEITKEIDTEILDLLRKSGFIPASIIDSEYWSIVGIDTNSLYADLR